MDKRPAVFLDRDGCVNVEGNHIRDLDQFRLYPESLNSIRKLNDTGFLVVVITNQSGVARGYMTEELVLRTHDTLREWATEADVRIDGIYYCPHHPEGAVEKYAIHCQCRKPAPGMLYRADEDLGIDFPRSFVVGDKISDIALGPAVGARSILVRTGFGVEQLEKIKSGGAPTPDHVADGIGDAVIWILDHHGAAG
ncbi:MAG: HAD-IIIA family hydrolase [Nitrospinota bacterium]|nr:HAD-IIIA family hydrolase [Nitrospinota bacterium]